MNARAELLQVLKDKAPMLCATISHEGYSYGEKLPAIMLAVGYNQEDYNTFLKALNFEYDNGFGGQELYGTVWLTDGTWLSRGEYDGSEWWDHHVCPVIPETLKK